MASAIPIAGAMAQDDHARRLAAELAIMAGDARALAREAGGPQQRAGLVQRLHGALSSLPLQLRRAGDDPQTVTVLRDTLSRKDWQGFLATLAPLARRHRFDARRLLTAPATAQTLAMGAALHRENCAACHDTTWGDTLLPAQNLGRQLAAMPREEFAARLWLGVRGTRDTAYANPFSDGELAALIAYYGQTR